MKANYYTFLISTILTILSFVTSLLITVFTSSSNIMTFISNILIGIVASGILLIVSSLIGYINCKKSYYSTIVNNLYRITSIIEDFTVELSNKTCESSSKYVSEILSTFYSIRLDFLDYKPFLNRKHKIDIIIESYVVELIRFLLILNQLTELDVQLKTQKINMNSHQEGYSIVAAELNKAYNSSLTKLYDMLKDTSSNFSKDKALHSILDDK